MLIQKPLMLHRDVVTNSFLIVEQSPTEREEQQATGGKQMPRQQLCSVRNLRLLDWKAVASLDHFAWQGPFSLFLGTC